GIILIFIGRVHLIDRIFDPLPGYDKTAEFHGWDDFSNDLLDKSEGLPIISNGFQLCSKLSFYTGQIIPSINFMKYGNEFDLWELDKEYYGKTVMFLGSFPLKGSLEMQAPDGRNYYLSRVNNYRNYSKVTIEPVSKKLFGIKGEIMRIKVRINNPYQYPITNDPATANPVSISYHVLQKGKIITWEGKRTPIKPILGKQEQFMEIKVPKWIEEYEIQFCLVSSNFLWWENSKTYRFFVHNR
ncbi:MAG: hypothetical protein IH946_06905, partial [Bacteroidetes bacterium]|nr:hypothetical protein [Bacteroidota bacterium]